jgi:hypothetical protein
VRKQQFWEQCILFIWVIFQEWKITRGKQCIWEGRAEVYCPLHNAGHHMTNKMVSITMSSLKILLSWDVTMCLWINSSSHSEGSWCLQNTGNCTQGHSVTCQMISIFSNTVVRNSNIVFPKLVKSYYIFIQFLLDFPSFPYLRNTTKIGQYIWYGWSLLSQQRKVKDL